MSNDSPLSEYEEFHAHLSAELGTVVGAGIPCCLNSDAYVSEIQERFGAQADSPRTMMRRAHVATAVFGDVARSLGLTAVDVPFIVQWSRLFWNDAPWTSPNGMISRSDFQGPLLKVNVLDHETGRMKMRIYCACPADAVLLALHLTA